ncbi:MAG: hypothetical protein K1V84_00300 [Muribaculaceae bacterium]
MEKLIKKSLLLFVTVLLSVAAASCSKDKDDEPGTSTDTSTDPLVGTWVEKNSSMPYTLILNADHTGTISFDTSSRALLTDHFNWSTVTSDGSTYLNTIHTSGDVIFENVQNLYVLAGNELIVLINGYQINFTRAR